MVDLQEPDQKFLPPGMDRDVALDEGDDGFLPSQMIGVGETHATAIEAQSTFGNTVSRVTRMGMLSKKRPE